MQHHSMATFEILSVFGIKDLPFDDDDIEITLSSQIIENVQLTVRKSSEQNPDIIRSILHDAGFDGFDDKIIPVNLDTIHECPSTAKLSSTISKIVSFPDLTGTADRQTTASLPDINTIASANRPQIETKRMPWLFSLCCLSESGLRSLPFIQDKKKKINE